jgi:hypothetical protein
LGFTKTTAFACKYGLALNGSPDTMKQGHLEIYQSLHVKEGIKKIKAAYLNYRRFNREEDLSE